MKKFVAVLAVSALFASSSVAFSQVKIVPETQDSFVHATQSLPGSASSFSVSPVGVLTAVLVVGIVLALINKNRGDDHHYQYEH